MAVFTFPISRIRLWKPQQMLKALKKLPGFENYDKDGVQIFKSTVHLVNDACKHASLLISKQDNHPKKDPFTNFHLLIKRFLTLKEAQNYFGKN